MTNFEDKMTALNAYPVFGETAVPVAGDSKPTFEAIERHLGAPLPDVYKDFARRYGQHGFEQYVDCPVDPRFPLGDGCMVGVFFGLRAEAGYSLVEEYDQYRGRMPAHLLPIANDPGGNLFVLSVGKDDYGKVYYWDREHVDVTKERVQQMADELEIEGIDTSRLFIDRIIGTWEDRHRAKLDRPPWYGNLYAVGESFSGFIEALRPYVPPEPEPEPDAA